MVLFTGKMKIFRLIMAYKKPSSGELAELQNAAHRMRIDSIECTTVAGSGHPTSCASAAEVMSVLFKKVMKYNIQDPGHASNDRFVLSKGHAAPVLYAAWKEVGFLKEDLNNLRKFTSDLEGKLKTIYLIQTQYFSKVIHLLHFHLLMLPLDHWVKVCPMLLVWLGLAKMLTRHGSNQ